jgi:hypothetical protein
MCMPYDTKVESLELPHLSFRFNLVVLVTDPAHHGVAEAGDIGRKPRQWHRDEAQTAIFWV